MRAVAKRLPAVGETVGRQGRAVAERLVGRWWQTEAVGMGRTATAKRGGLVLVFCDLYALCNVCV